MALRPCLTCGTPTDKDRCPPHRRDTNLPTKLLPQLLATRPHLCHFCRQPITEGRGRTPGAPSIEHLDGNPQHNNPDNLALAHYGCNAANAGSKPSTPPTNHR